MDNQAEPDGERAKRERAADEMYQYIVDNLLGGVELTTEELAEADRMLRVSIARTASRRSAAG
ncbi:hypothetical protein ACFOSC_19140 [Streptantibioticus rubrisoli]|uniref:Uncharacterized protein n=1 Tax=Streptantibioticus rubrisoli TaxID=1387313 RepID=A0ABT1PJ71_9ACTN|nr:hypothetical protein [Streptantibioticus rubrisoli]MCQ4045416.1 hypothetical protein [Streptantibioticus rubrisoli]